MSEINLVAILGEADAIKYRQDKAKVIAVKSLEKGLEAMDKKIKAYLAEQGIKDGAANGFTFKLGSQDRSTMNEEKLVSLLQTKGLTNALKQVTISDPDAVAEYIKTGELTVDALNECKNSNIINTLTVKYVETVPEFPPGTETGRFPASAPNTSAEPKKMF